VSFSPVVTLVCSDIERYRCRICSAIGDKNIGILTSIQVLITGGNSGVGFGLASQLLNRGTYHVLLGSRSTDKGRDAVKDLQARHESQSDAVELLQIDVTDDDSIDKAAVTVRNKHGKVDVV